MLRNRFCSVLEIIERKPVTLPTYCTSYPRCNTRLEVGRRVALQKVSFNFEHVASSATVCPVYLDDMEMVHLSFFLKLNRPWIRHSTRRALAHICRTTLCPIHMPSKATLGSQPGQGWMNVISLKTTGLSFEKRIIKIPMGKMERRRTSETLRKNRPVDMFSFNW